MLRGLGFRVQGCFEGVGKFEPLGATSCKNGKAGTVDASTVEEAGNDRQR